VGGGWDESTRPTLVVLRRSMAAKRVFDARNSHVRSFPVERNVASFGRRGTPRTKLSLNVRPIGTCWNPRCVGSTAVHPNHVGDVQAGCFGRAEFVRVKRSRNEPNATCTRIGNSLSTRIHCGRQFRHCATELVHGWLSDGIQCAHKVFWSARGSLCRPRGAPRVRSSSKRTCLEASVYAEPKPVPIPNAATAALLVAFRNSSSAAVAPASPPYTLLRSSRSMVRSHFSSNVSASGRSEGGAIVVRTARRRGSRS